MVKTYILDTNILLHDPESIFAFEDNEVVIPLLVIEELDDHKRRPDEVGRNARVVARKLDELRAKGPLSEGIDLPKGGRLRIELNHHDLSHLPPGVDLDKPDNRILVVSLNLHKRTGKKVILVTKDLNLRIKADVIGVTTEDYYSDKVDYTELYSGVAELFVPTEKLDVFYKAKELPLNGLGPGRENQFFVLKNELNPSQSALARCQGDRLLPLSFSQAAPMGIRARNKEQSFALELLLDDKVSVITLAGPAGTGKTLLAVAAGLEKVLEENVYSRLLVTRPVTPLGEDLGFLPGSKEEKLKPWMQPIQDNLEFIFHQAEDPRSIQAQLKDQGMLEMEALTYIRGRSIPGQFIICDEAQNLTPHMVKTLVTRAGEGTKIVFTGDPEQIDHPYLDSSSNGLSYLVEKLKGQVLAGHVTLIKGERSAVAELGARLL
jgi:PhoH-like ATPase